MSSKPLEAATAVISGLLQLVDFHRRGDGGSDVVSPSEVGSSGSSSAHFLSSLRSRVRSSGC